MNRPAPFATKRADAFVHRDASLVRAGTGFGLARDASPGFATRDFAGMDFASKKISVEHDSGAVTGITSDTPGAVIAVSSTESAVTFTEVSPDGTTTDSITIPLVTLPAEED